MSLSKPRVQNVHTNRCCIKPAGFVVSSRFPSLKFQNFVSPPLKSENFFICGLKVRWFLMSEVKVQSFLKLNSNSTDSCSNSKDDRFDVLKSLKIAAVVILLMMMCGLYPALARVDGLLSGNSYLSSLKSCSGLCYSIISAAVEKLLYNLLKGYLALREIPFNKFEQPFELAVLLAALIHIACNSCKESRLGLKIRVIKFQVGLRSAGSGVQRRLNSCSKVAAATSSAPNRFRILLSGAGENLSNAFGLYTAVYSSVKEFESEEDAVEYLKKLSDEERDKLGVERLVDIPNVNYRTTITNEDPISYTRHLVTVMVAAKGEKVDKFPPYIPGTHKRIRIAADILEEIAPTAEIQALDVLWADAPCEKELFKERPYLREIEKNCLEPINYVLG